MKNKKHDGENHRKDTRRPQSNGITMKHGAKQVSQPPQEVEPDNEDVIPAWVRKQPVKAKVLALIVFGYTTGDYGTEGMSREILADFGEECRAAAREGKCDPETLMAIGAWLEQEVWLAHC